jgi:hypothetical protein
MIDGYDFHFAELFLISLLLTSLTVLTHNYGMNLVRRFFRRFWLGTRNHVSRQMVMVGIVGIMMAVHYVELLIWAMFYYLRGIVHHWSSSVRFSIASYTTLGNSNITLPEHWQGLGALESMNAMLMYGWSTALLAAVVIKIHSLED